MITIIAFIIFAFLIFRLWKDNFFNVGEKVVITFVITGVALVIILFVYNIFVFFRIFDFANPVETERVNCTNQIYSLKNETGLTGNFVLGSGYIKSDEYYHTFTKNDRGGYHREQLRSVDCVLYQNENKNPRMTWQIVTYRPSRWVHIWPVFNWMRQKQNTMYDLFVPENTIIQEFKID